LSHRLGDVFRYATKPVSSTSGPIDDNSRPQLAD
jgi:hypothetical protein